MVKSTHNQTASLNIWAKVHHSRIGSYLARVPVLIKCSTPFSSMECREKERFKVPRVEGVQLYLCGSSGI